MKFVNKTPRKDLSYISIRKQRLEEVNDYSPADSYNNYNSEYMRQSLLDRPTQASETFKSGVQMSYCSPLRVGKKAGAINAGRVSEVI